MRRFTENNIEYINFAGNDAAYFEEAYGKLEKSANGKDIIQCIHTGDSYFQLGIFNIKDAVVVIKLEYEGNLPGDEVDRVEIRVASASPDYRRDAISKLEEITGIDLTQEEAPAK